MFRKNTVISVVTERKPCTAEIEFMEVPDDIEAIGSFLYPQNSATWQMPFLVTEESKSQNESDLETLYPGAIQYLLLQALNKDVSILDFADSLVIFCERFGQLFRQNRISVIEARQKITWSWLLLHLYRISTKQRNASKTWVDTLMRFIYEPYKLANKNFPDHTGEFIIDLLLINAETMEIKPFAHPNVWNNKKFTGGLIVPNKGPRNNEKDVILKWCQDVMQRNLNDFFKRAFKLAVKVDSSMRLNISIKATGVYSASLLSFIDKDIDWLSRDDISILRSKDDYRSSLARKDRRDVLAVFRNRKNRQTAKQGVTESEYKELVEYSKRFILEHLSKEKMEEEMKAQLNKMRKRKKSVGQ